MCNVCVSAYRNGNGDGDDDDGGYYLLSICAFSKSLRKSPSLDEFLSIAILWCHRRGSYFLCSERSPILQKIVSEERREREQN